MPEPLLSNRPDHATPPLKPCCGSRVNVKVQAPDCKASRGGPTPSPYFFELVTHPPPPCSLHSSYTSLLAIPQDVRHAANSGTLPANSLLLQVFTQMYLLHEAYFEHPK